MHGPETQILQKPRGPDPSPGFLFRALVLGASSGARQLGPPLSGKHLFSYPKLMHPGRNREGLGPSVGPHPPTPAGSCRKSAKLSQPMFRAAVVLPRWPHPASCKSLSQQEQKIRWAILGWGEEKPQQLLSNWHSIQLEASKRRNELNKLFFPFRVEYRLQVSTQVTP